MIEATEAATGCAVEETIGDCAYGDGGTRKAFHDAKRTLVAKVPTMTNQGCFPKTDFTLDLEADRPRASQIATTSRPLANTAVLGFASSRTSKLRRSKNSISRSNENCPVLPYHKQVADHRALYDPIFQSGSGQP